MNSYGFRHVARMEWIKLRSLRSTWWLAAVTVVAMGATGAGVGLGYRSHTPVATAAQILNNSLSGAILAQLLLGALGALMVTGEYGTGMIRSTFVAVPRRRTVLVAKAAVCAGTALAVGLTGSLAGYLGGQLAIRGTAIPAAGLGDPANLRAVLLTGVYLAATALIGLGVVGAGRRLTLTVTDDGGGGANPDSPGLTGLSVDGRMRVHSPAGGPTRVEIELPTQM